MALVERLMGLNDDGTEPAESSSQKIPIHAFFAAASEVVAGALTGAQVKTLFGMRASDDASGRSDTGELELLMTKMPAATATAQRALFLERLHSVFILAEVRFSGYDTAVAVRSKLGI